MRVKMEFELKKREFLADYTRPMISFLKKSLKDYDVKVYEQIFESGNTLKNYSFSCYFHKAKFGKEFLKTEGNIMKVIFSCSDVMEGMLFVNAFIGQRDFAFPLKNENSMVLKKIELLPSERIENETVLVKFLSPLLVQEHFHEKNKSWYYTPEDKNFDDVLRHVVSYQLSSNGMSLKETDITLKPIQYKKIIVPVFGIKVPATIGMFELTADKQVLQHLYESGIGSKRGAGFGLFEVIEEKRG